MKMRISGFFFCFADCAVWIAALSLLHRVAAVTFKAYGKFFETEVSRLRRSVVLKSGDGLCRMAELDIGLNVFSEAWLVLLCAVAWRPPPSVSGRYRICEAVMPQRFKVSRLAEKQPVLCKASAMLVQVQEGAAPDR
ncbi:hypothetical protein F2S70_01200 [Pseudomonas syringae pv. actinidiae]|nr:hypothetical protein [Pseudomonas syringae pv. actinidiae]NVL34444.1 hypothetical protein [Pseudomonas syringae pv. actinidiae]NVL53515.1 hypothetical protein [Pseudomonas syringae pv. actinidiae]